MLLLYDKGESLLNFLFGKTRNDALLDYITEVGFDPVCDVRSVKRVNQKYLLKELSRSILFGNVNKEKGIIMDYVNGEIVF